MGILHVSVERRYLGR